MPVYIGLLRAVNLGRGTQVRMEELRDLVQRAGLEDVRTLLQSGNVVFRSPRVRDSDLERLLARRVAQELRVPTEVFVRTAEEWESVLAENPFDREAGTTPVILWWWPSASRHRPSGGRRSLPRFRAASG